MRPRSPMYPPLRTRQLRYLLHQQRHSAAVQVDAVAGEGAVGGLRPPVVYETGHEDDVVALRQPHVRTVGVDAVDAGDGLALASDDAAWAFLRPTTAIRLLSPDNVPDLSCPLWMYLPLIFPPVSYGIAYGTDADQMPCDYAVHGRS